jgi:hypothetical protein
MSTTAQVLHITSDTGDWSASHDGLGVSSYQAIQDEVGNVVALVVAQSDDYYADPNPEPYSRLFAAAPDLLEACKRLTSLMRLAGWEGDDATQFGLHAIGKATGERA